MYDGRSTESTTRSASSENNRSRFPELFSGSVPEFTHFNRISKARYCLLENWAPFFVGRQLFYLLLWPGKQAQESEQLYPNGRRMGTMSTPGRSIPEELDAASLHTIMTGSNETIMSANKPMFFLEMNPFAPVSVVLLHMLCKIPNQVCLLKNTVHLCSWRSPGALLQRQLFRAD